MAMDERYQVTNAPGTDPEAGSSRLQPEYDTELAKYGGWCDSKFQVGQVTIRLPLDLRPLPVLALFFSFVPWLVPMVLFFHFAYSRNLYEIYALCLMLFATILSEVILKPVCNQPRPNTTACRYADGRPKLGMPSGHVLNAQTVIVFFVCEVMHGLPTPFPSAWQAVALLLVLMPIFPWARWYNGDHTVNQCLVSMLLGTILGLFGFFGHVLFMPNSLHVSLVSYPLAGSPFSLASPHKVVNGLGFLGAAAL